MRRAWSDLYSRSTLKTIHNKEARPVKFNDYEWREAVTHRGDLLQSVIPAWVSPMHAAFLVGLRVGSSVAEVQHLLKGDTRVALRHMRDRYRVLTWDHRLTQRGLELAGLMEGLMGPEPQAPRISIEWNGIDPAEEA